jgi:hypothetical protein
MTCHNSIDMTNLTIQKGNLYTATITFTDSTGAAYDLTGKTVFFTAKKKNDNLADDSLAVITEDITVHTDPTNGITTLSLSTTQTDVPLGCYKCDFRIYQAGVLQNNTVTFYADVIDIITKRII